MQNFTFITSLSPNDERGVQPQAVQSWVDHGAKVLALNTSDEIDALQDTFPTVEFVPTARTAEQHAGRPVPYIYDLLATARAKTTEGDTIGIINADIFLRPVDGLLPWLQTEAESAVILGPRVDVSNTQAFKTYTPESSPTFSVGYDYFVMGRDLVDDFNDNPFALGMPFWDYWLPLTCHLAGRTLKALLSPVALHVHHETRWDDTVYLFFHSLIAYALEQSKSTAADETPVGRQLSFFLNVVAHHYGSVFENGTGGREVTEPDANAVAALADFYDHFQETAVHTIKTNAQTIRFDCS